MRIFIAFRLTFLELSQWSKCWQLELLVCGMIRFKTVVRESKRLLKKLFKKQQFKLMPYALYVLFRWVKDGKDLE